MSNSEQSCSLIAVGGSGIRSTYAFLQLCAAGGMRGIRKTIHILVVDTDSKENGNTNKLVHQHGRYMRLRDSWLSQLELPEITLDLAYSISSNVKSLKTPILEDLNLNHREQLLIRSLLSEKDINDERVEEGLFGCPTKGAFVFDYLFSNPSHNEYLPIARDFLANKVGQEPVVLVGSSFGGTGTSGITQVLQWLRRLNPNNKKTAVTMLTPYFQIQGPAATVLNTSQAQTKSKEALQHYLDFDLHEFKDIQALYLVGSNLNSDSLPIRGRAPVPDVSREDNMPHICELISAQSLALHFTQSIPVPGNVYTYEEQVVDNALWSTAWKPLMQFEIFSHSWAADFLSALMKEQFEEDKINARENKIYLQNILWLNARKFKKDWFSVENREQLLRDLTSFFDDFLNWLDATRHEIDRTECSILSVANMRNQDRKHPGKKQHVKYYRHKLWEEACFYKPEGASDLLRHIHDYAEEFIPVKPNGQIGYEAFHCISENGRNGWSNRTHQSAREHILQRNSAFDVPCPEAGWPLLEGHIRKQEELLQRPIPYASLGTLFEENANDQIKAIENWLMFASLIALRECADAPSHEESICADRCRICKSNDNTGFPNLRTLFIRAQQVDSTVWSRLYQEPFGPNKPKHIITLQWWNEKGCKGDLCLDKCSFACSTTPHVLGVLHANMQFIPSKDFCSEFSELPNDPLAKALRNLRALWLQPNTSDSTKKRQLEYIKKYLKNMQTIPTVAAICRAGLARLSHVEEPNTLVIISTVSGRKNLLLPETVLPSLLYPIQ